MGWYYDYRPYVSIAQRRREAFVALEQRRKKGLPVSPIVIQGRAIATTFWGQAWCTNLEGYSDFENRLPRGRTYARNGSVVHLEIRQGKISALVSGSSLYTVEITISPVARASWARVKNHCAGQIGSLVELLQGRLSKHVMDVVTRRDGGLFPASGEIKMSCSCPDSAGMCKHVAATMYGVGARLDHEPHLLFLLRDVDHLELIEAAAAGMPVDAAPSKKKKKGIAASDIADVFGIELAGADEQDPASVGGERKSQGKASAASVPRNKSGAAKAATSVSLATRGAASGGKRTAAKGQAKTARATALKTPAKAKATVGASKKSKSPAIPTRARSKGS